MGLAAIGPVVLGEHEHGNPTYSIGGLALPSGNEPATFGGLLTWAHCMELRELVKNPTRRETIGETTGVREVIEFTGALLSPLTGWYLLTGFSFDANKAATMSAETGPFTLTAAYIGDLSSRVAVLTVAPMTMASQYGITPQTFVAIPPSAADAAAGLMRVVANGVESTRRYDPDINS